MSSAEMLPRRSQRSAQGETASQGTAPVVDITRNFIRAKRPCAEGFRWFLRRQEVGSNYQALLDDLVREGRVTDACWLLDQFGPTDDVLRVDQLHADALVFAGSVECTGNADIGGLLRTGRDLHVHGGLQVGEDVQVGGALRVDGPWQCGGKASVGSDVRIGWGLAVAGVLQCDAGVRVGWDMRCAAPVRIAGDLSVGRELEAQGDFHCAGRVRTGGDLCVQGAIDVGRGIEAAGSVVCSDHLQVGWGVRAGGSIASRAAIRVGESLFAGESIEAGDEYGIFAGLAVPMQAWESSGFVQALHKPQRLFSGHWNGA